jgi:hypothetical protein
MNLAVNLQVNLALCFSVIATPLYRVSLRAGHQSKPVVTGTGPRLGNTRVFQVQGWMARFRKHMTPPGLSG